MCGDEPSPGKSCGICLGVVSFLLLIILLPISFVYFEYNEMGFIKYTITNNVNTEETRLMGRYYTGPSHAPVVFPRSYQRVNSRLAIFPDNGQEFYINVISFIRLNPDTLSMVYEQFGTSSVTNQASIRIDSEIKSIAPTFSISEYILDREAIRATFFYGTDDGVNPGLQADLAVIGVTLEYDKFWMEEVEMPATIEQRNLDAAVQLEVNTQEENEREAILVQTETDRLEQLIIANITIVNANATALVELINAEAAAAIVTIDATADASIKRAGDEAVAEASNLLATTEGAGFDNFFAALNLTAETDEAIMSKYIAYFALLKQQEAANALVIS